jgi:predicted metallo-beta-lactamase superfamily hydrolase
MCTYIETSDSRFLIDPGADVGPYRYGLKPHPLEEFCLKKHRERIALYAGESEVLIITHFHLDHFHPDSERLYAGKILLIKNPNQHINISQRRRAFQLLERIEASVKEVSYVDGRTFRFGETRLVFSSPLPHGATSQRGYVVSVAIHADEKRFLYTSDVQGPRTDEHLAFILKQNPDVLYIDGPTTYLREDAETEEPLDETLDRLKRLLDNTSVSTLIIDHHLLRDISWEERIDPLFTLAHERGVIVQTAAQYRGEENDLLEARRNGLYQSDPPE